MLVPSCESMKMSSAFNNVCAPHGKIECEKVMNTFCNNWSGMSQHDKLGDVDSVWRLGRLEFVMNHS